VRAAAEFGGKVSDFDDPHALAVFFPEQRHGLVFVDSHVNGHVFDGLDFGVLEDFFVGEIFDVLQLFIGDGSEVRKIKAQMLGINQRAGLLHMLAQRLA